VGNSVIYQNNTSIGINTTTTLDILDVAGSITAEVDGGPTSGPALDLRNTPPTGFGIGSVNFFTYPGQTVPSAQWQAKDIGGFTADQTLYTAGSLNQRNQPLIARLTVKGGTGNVGIGTTTPVAPLEVNGNAQVDGNLTVGGNILSPGIGGPVIQAPNNGSNNFSAGLGALPATTTGTYNTAVGDNTLQVNTTGVANTATGSSALAANTTGFANTATGSSALSNNTTGAWNTATGQAALTSNTTGNENTATGDAALFNNSNGFANTATGYSALSLNTSGNDNTATGTGALVGNTTGNDNTATGGAALGGNTTGSYNTAIGGGALYSNTTGGGNTATGVGALTQNKTGSNNIAIGYDAGYNVTTSNNIHLGSQGFATDSGIIRIGCMSTSDCGPGVAPQTAAFIAGIWGATTQSSGAVPVLVDSNGNLGVASSSRRYKEDIQDMGDTSSGLLRLRPVTFRYKKPYADGSQPIQYGLIAEEVAEVYPDLVARSADGQIETVKYQVLDSMLLNELQKQNVTIAAQKDQIRSLEDRLARVEAVLERSSCPPHPASNRSRGSGAFTRTRPKPETGRPPSNPSSSWRAWRVLCVFARNRMVPGDRIRQEISPCQPPTARLARPIIRYTQTKDGFPDASKAALVLSVPRPHLFMLAPRRHLRTPSPGSRHRGRRRRHRRQPQILHQRLRPGGTELRRQGRSRQSHL
jgi:hypothetical protein